MMREQFMTLRVIVGDEEVHRLPAESIDMGGPFVEHYTDERPNAALVVRPLTIWFGPTTRSPRRTKRVKGICRFEGDATEAAWQAAEDLARADLADALARHGVAITDGDDE